MNQVIINTNRFKTRAAVLENGKVMEVHIEREGEGTLNGNIYKGKVANVLPGMESAFEIGRASCRERVLRLV